MQAYFLSICELEIISWGSNYNYKLYQTANWLNDIYLFGHQHLQIRKIIESRGKESVSLSN